MLKKINLWALKLYARQDEIKQEMRQTLANQRGAGAVEYGLVIAVIVVIVISAAMTMEGPLKTFFGKVVEMVMGFVGG